MQAPAGRAPVKALPANSKSRLIQRFTEELKANRELRVKAARCRDPEKLLREYLPQFSAEEGWDLNDPHEIDVLCTLEQEVIKELRALQMEIEYAEWAAAEQEELEAQLSLYDQQSRNQA
eukprot:TRINITY_DN7502_c0_g1_i1.p1 TRINITY_DN7502_c0_g1~~TRINITY_DN7502_c0_g1_i1.p1  ORF type:complete len:120 (-),score=19.68 TRINITY_DN7502_c0_g1_i1:13-372(-)